MPTAVDKLTPKSDNSQISAAISDCIAYHMKHEGLTQEQASGKCYGMVKQKTGKEPGKKNG